jgi:hypothetical protein
MKVLFLSQGHKVEDQPGWNYALEQLKKEQFITDFHNIPYRGYASKYGWPAFYDHVLKVCRENVFDIVFFQYFHGNKNALSPLHCIQKLRELPNRPLIMTSSGDPFSEDWMRPDYPAGFKECSRLADITFSTQMGKASDKMVRWGAKNVVCAPHSMCPVRFQARHIDPTSHHFDFDVVFVGSRNKPRVFNPASKVSWSDRNRKRLVLSLVEQFGSRFGLFGYGWNGLSSWQGPIPFDQQQNAFQRGRIVVGANPYSYSDYYASNRPFFEIASGVPTVELAVPRLDRVLRDQDHCYFCQSIKDVVRTCDRLLKWDPVDLYAKAARAADYIAERHTQYHRMKFMLETAIRYQRNSGTLDVVFPFFLPEVDLAEESKYAVRSK